ncbi:RDD family protein [Leptolyngbya sp. AN02str]|uniref:RDD family protein n=1 Tax=Leptolyngbya sp. AN02str TaxID=3423363 RepID=UPI003D31364A
MRPQLASTRLPKVPIRRRGYALGLDILTIGILSAFFGGSFWAQAFVFALGWWMMRVALVANNKGQSFGRWAFNMRIIERRQRITPTLLELTKRETILGICAFLAFWGVLHLSPTSAWVLLLMVPLGLDIASAYANVEQGIAFHDRYSDVSVVPSQRGYSLDVKIRQLVAEVQDRVKK